MAESNLQDQFNRKLDNFCVPDQPHKLAIAVSGGSDSVALALLMRNWAADKQIELVTLTVDHGLREEAREEAETVGKWMKSLGLHHELLVWKGPHPATGIQKAAREARYLLMADFCRDQDITALLLGHQLEDQLETLLMRLSKGSGLEGLAAMKDDSYQFGLRLLRPLLKIERLILRDYLVLHNQGWIEDPSNDNLKFTRTQVGTVLSGLAALPGSDLSAISLSAQRIARASEALDTMTSQRMQEFCPVSPLGFVRFREEVILDCPAEIGIRLLNRIFCKVRGKPVSQKLQALENIYMRLFQRKQSASETLGGVQILKSGNEWLVCREPGREGLPEISFSGKKEVIWDQRFHVTDTAAEKDRDVTLTVKRIGPDGWRQIQAKTLQIEAVGLPARVRNNLPAVWRGERMVAAPLFSSFQDQSTIAHDRFKMVFKTLI